MLLDNIQPTPGKGTMVTFMHQILLPGLVDSFMANETQLGPGCKGLVTFKPFLRLLWLLLGAGFEFTQNFICLA